jgi:hypothetical protein
MRIDTYMFLDFSGFSEFSQLFLSMYVCPRENQ